MNIIFYEWEKIYKIKKITMHTHNISYVTGVTLSLHQHQLCNQCHTHTHHCTDYVTGALHTHKQAPVCSHSHTTHYSHPTLVHSHIHTHTQTCVGLIG